MESRPTRITNALVQDLARGESTNDAISHNIQVAISVEYRYNNFYQCDEIRFHVPSQYLKGFVTFHYKNTGKERNVPFHGWIQLEGEIDTRSGKTILVVERRNI